MQITDVRVFPVRDDKLKAFVSVVFESCFMVNDIKVINGRDGYFISMPSRRKKNGEFKDIAHPLNTDTRRMLEERILDEYEQVVALNEPPVRRYQKEQESGEAEADAPPREAPTEESPAAAPVSDESRDESAAQAGPVEEGRPVAAEDDGSEDERDAVEPDRSTIDRDESDRDEPDRDGSQADDKNRKDMDEVVETHLSDAFWS